MHDLAAMRIFVGVADAGAFAAAARRMNLSTSVVSHHVSKLERSLGVPLLQRSTRRLGLTDAGVKYLARARAIVEEADHLFKDTKNLGDTPVGRVKLSVPPGVAEYLATPFILKFLERHEEISITLDVTDRITDLIAEGFDAAIRTGEMHNSNLRCRRLAEITFTLCASPEYCARHGTPEQPEDLADHRIAHWISRSGQSFWIFNDDKRTIDVAHEGRLIVNNVSSLHQAALDGVAIAALPDFLVRKDVLAGRLVSLLDGFEINSVQIWMVWPDNFVEPYKLRLLIDHITASMAQIETWRDGHSTPKWNRIERTSKGCRFG
ncbi:MAG: LysR family transcriptional regulator [Hyphomicrobiales bacterium]